MAVRPRCEMPRLQIRQTVAIHSLRTTRAGASCPTPAPLGPARQTALPPSSLASACVFRVSCCLVIISGSLRRLLQDVLRWCQSPAVPLKSYRSHSCTSLRIAPVGFTAASPEFQVSRVSTPRLPEKVPISKFLSFQPTRALVRFPPSYLPSRVPGCFVVCFVSHDSMSIGNSVYRVNTQEN